MTDNEIWEKIDSLDLSEVREKFKYKKSWVWRLFHNMDVVETDYKKFLFLIVKHPNEVIVPWNNNLDLFWHEHILDTAKYQTDCLNIAGKFIHHNPHLKVGTKKQAESSRKTNQLYKETYGSDMILPFTSCGVGPAACSSISDSVSDSISGISCSTSSCGGGCSGSSCGSGCGGGD